MPDDQHGQQHGQGAASESKPQQSGFRDTVAVPDSLTFIINRENDSKQGYSSKQKPKNVAGGQDNHSISCDVSFVWKNTKSIILHFYKKIKSDVTILGNTTYDLPHR